MKKTTPPLLLVISLAIVACALLTYTITRAAMLSMTPDELATIETFGAKFIVYPDTYHFMTANHHWLNSWLIFFSRSVFGDSEFAFRIPNLIAHAFYLFFTARLMLGMRKDYFALAGFILLNAHPYVLDFFSLARGYGLAFAGFSGGIYFLHRFICEDKSKHIVFALISMFLAVLGNFGMLTVFLLFSGMLGLISLRKIKSETRKTISRLGIIILFCGGLLLLIVPHLIKMKAAGGFSWERSSFWKGSIGSLCSSLLYDAPYKGKDILKSCSPSIYIATGMLAVFSLIAVIKKRWLESGTLLALSCIIICFGTILAIHLQSIFLDMPYPPGRMVLFLFVLFIFAFVTALASIQFAPKLSASFAFLLAVPIVFHMLSCSNMHYAIDWRGSGDVDRLMARVVEDRKQSGDPKTSSVIVSADGEASCTIAWLHYSKWKLTWLQNNTCWTYDPMPESDYYIVTKKFTEFRDKSGWKMIDTCPVSGNALYIDTLSFFYRTGKSYQKKSYR